MLALPLSVVFARFLSLIHSDYHWIYFIWLFYLISFWLWYLLILFLQLECFRMQLAGSLPQPRDLDSLGHSQYCWLELGHPFPFLFSLDSFHMHRSQHLWHFDCSVPIFIFQMLAYVYNLLVYDIVYYLKLYFGISVFIHLVRWNVIGL